MDHISSKLNELQYGFQRGKSSPSQLLHVLHNIHKILEKRCQVDTIYLDFAKAFDKVSRFQSSIPNDFRTAIISPIHKAGCKTECNNYRPISIQKIFEKLITQQLETYLEKNEILVQQQAGFRKKHCTQTSLLNITNQ